jgi:hypothetical protein
MELSALNMATSAECDITSDQVFSYLVIINILLLFTGTCIINEYKNISYLFIKVYIF